jgi:hypothetical protein
MHMCPDARATGRGKVELLASWQRGMDPGSDMVFLLDLMCLITRVSSLLFL